MMTDTDAEILNDLRKRLLRTYIFVGTRRVGDTITLMGKLDVRGRWKHLGDLTLPIDITTV